jgi:HEPN domain-containing protein
VPIARLNRDALLTLAASRLEEARVLLENKLWTGAYYMTGLALECALKSCLAAEVNKHDFPDKNFVNAMYVHKLESLFGLNGALWAALQADIKTNQKLSVNWSTVKDWDDAKRYAIVEELEARALYDACIEPGSGIMEWIKAIW